MGLKDKIKIAVGLATAADQLRAKQDERVRLTAQKKALADALPPLRQLQLDVLDDENAYATATAALDAATTRERIEGERLQGLIDRAEAALPALQLAAKREQLAADVQAASSLPDATEKAIDTMLAAEKAHEAARKAYASTDSERIDRCRAIRALAAEVGEPVPFWAKKSRELAGMLRLEEIALENARKTMSGSALADYEYHSHQRLLSACKLDPTMIPFDKYPREERVRDILADSDVYVARCTKIAADEAARNEAARQKHERESLKDQLYQHAARMGLIEDDSDALRRGLKDWLGHKADPQPLRTAAEQLGLVLRAEELGVLAPITTPA